MPRYSQTQAQTNKLYCSECDDPIQVGQSVVFCVSEKGKWLDVWCLACAINLGVKEQAFHDEMICEGLHPRSEENFGATW